MRRIFGFAVLLLLASGTVLADAGILLPRDRNQPDPAVLSLDEMEINVVIDNGDARVYIRQIFANHTNRIEEGTYIFALPSRATVSDFAVWDGPTRIPATILERKRAGEIYNELKAQMIDPGLLQMGERGAEEARRSNVFNARIVPIAAYGTKRLEIEYHEAIPVEDLKSQFAIPLHPDAYHAQAAGWLRINFELRSAHNLADFQLLGSTYPLKLTDKTVHAVKGTFEGRNVQLGEDFAMRWELASNAVDTVDVLAYRNPDSGEPSPTEISPVRSHNEPGFFEVQALLGAGPAAKKDEGASRTVIVLFDNSLSMQWDKLERSYAAMEQLLRSMRPADRFNLLLFNNKVAAFQPQPVSADRPTVLRALDFVRASRLRGGTDLEQALGTALDQCAANPGTDPYIVLLSDGGPTRGAINSGRLARWYESRWKRLPEVNRPRTYIFAVGDDANLPLLRMLARNEGQLENVLSTEPIDFKLNAFLSKIGRNPVGQLRLDATPSSAVDLVYALQDSAFAGSMASWVGQYRAPSTVEFAVHGVRDATPLDLKKSASLPAQSLDHPQLPRLWARARVDALLEKIEREGEDAKSIDEIIALSRKYKFVTPYTSFLAVPRALLRPRVIRPGDPVLRVHTDESITSVVAIFPFGLTKRLRHLDSENVWQTRFLAPDDMQDGTYSVRLVLRDRTGHAYRESKTFVIASKPPVVNIRLDTRRYHRGERIPLRVAATASTRTLIARLEGASPVGLHWDQKAGINTGDLLVPTDLPAGNYQLTVIAEDIAHNIGTQEVQIEVLP